MTPTTRDHFEVRKTFPKIFCPGCPDLELVLCVKTYLWFREPHFFMSSTPPPPKQGTHCPPENSNPCIHPENHQHTDFALIDAPPPKAEDHQISHISGRGVFPGGLLAVGQMECVPVLGSASPSLWNQSWFYYPL